MVSPCKTLRLCDFASDACFSCVIRITSVPTDNAGTSEFLLRVVAVVIVVMVVVVVVVVIMIVAVVMGMVMVMPVIMVVVV